MTTASTLKSPIPYDASLEVVDDDEAKTIDELTESLLKISDTTYKDLHRGLRSVHAKSHGIVEGRLEVMAGLAPELAQGLFARAGTYPIVMRFSTNPGDILDDKVSTPRGLAVKIIGVDGARLPGSDDATTQDFVLVNGPAFSASNAKSFAGNLKLLAGTTDKAPGLKQALSSVLQVTEKAIEALGGKSPTLLALGGHPETHVLGETYYSQVPLRHGDYVAKVAIAPLSPALRALTGAKVDLDDRPNGLRQAVVEHFARDGGEWELRVQLMRDRDSMPVEDASEIWPEDQSPYQAVARIVVEPQVAWSEARSKAVDDGLSFSPWHGLAAHRPLGSVMRARKATYEASVRARAMHGGGPVGEPSADYKLPT